MTMRSVQVRDDIVRTQEYALETDEMIHPHWRKYPFSPRQATVTFRNGQFQFLEVRGPHKRTDGGDAKTTGKISYYSLNEVPEFLRPVLQLTVLEA